MELEELVKTHGLTINFYSVIGPTHRRLYWTPSVGNVPGSFDVFDCKWIGYRYRGDSLSEAIKALIGEEGKK